MRKPILAISVLLWLMSTAIQAEVVPTYEGEAISFYSLSAGAVSQSFTVPEGQVCTKVEFYLFKDGGYYQKAGYSTTVSVSSVSSPGTVIASKTWAWNNPFWAGSVAGWLMPSDSSLSLPAGQYYVQVSSSNSSGDGVNANDKTYARLCTDSSYAGGVAINGYANGGTSLRGSNDFQARITVDTDVAPLTFSPLPGDYNEAQNVTISCATSGAVIRYTTDGSDPTETNGTVIASGSSVLVDHTLTLKARAWVGSLAGSIQIGVYSLVTSAPMMSGNQYVSGASEVTISCDTPNAVIYYTMDGTTPTMSSPVYTGPVAVCDGVQTTTLKAIAKAPNLDASVTTSVTYIHNPVRATNISRGHYLLIEKGLQIQTWMCGSDSGVLNWNTWNLSHFTTINTCTSACSELLDLSSSSVMSWSRILRIGTEDLTAGDLPFVSNLVSIQLEDEHSLTSDYIAYEAERMKYLRTKYPDAIVHTNQSGGQETVAQLQSYMQTAQPDMLMFDTYPFNGSIAGGSPTSWYVAMQKYRLLGLAGNDGDGTKPIPYGLYTQTYTGEGVTHVVSESEIRLNEFSTWAFGFKFISAYLYGDPNYHDIVTILFTNPRQNYNNPTAQFYQVAEANRQSRNLGPALVRLLSTDVRMLMGRHHGSRNHWYQSGSWEVDNTLPSGISAWSASADPYITSISASNPGNYNTYTKDDLVSSWTVRLPGDVIIGFYKPLHESFDGDSYSNQEYFMIVNGLSDAAGNANDCQQVITVDFNFGSSGINSLQRIRRSDGVVETITVGGSYSGLTFTSLGNNGYRMVLTLDGGTGDLFKYNTGAPFVGVISQPAISGDANDDGKVDVGDLGILAANYGMTSDATWAKGDFNGDGKVDVGDLGILAANYGTNASGADFDADYAKVFGPTAKDMDTSEDTDSSSSICSSLGLSLVAGLALLGLMLVKLDE